MRKLRRARLTRAATWLGLLALYLNALVPIHLAFDLAEALAGGPAVHATTGAHEQDGFRAFLAKLTGHREQDDKPRHPDGQGHSDCLVCSALGALGIFSPPELAALPVPSERAVFAVSATFQAFRAGAAPTAYFIRGPPVA